MKVLLDENMPHKLRTHLPKHEMATAAYAGFGGYKNGALLKAAEDAGFDVLVTGDLTLEYEQNITGRKIAAVSLSANSWKIVKNHVERIAAGVDAARRGSFTRVEGDVFLRPRNRPPSPKLGYKKNRNSLLCG